MGNLLDGLRVLDLSLWHPGHCATQLLADLGADVTKIEPPGGDRMRVLPDRFANFNGRKASVVLDLKNPSDLDRLKKLVGDHEVVVEGYRPGVADRLGVGYDALRESNSALVYCSISGFGQVGPLTQAPGHDWNYQAYAGAMVSTFAEVPPLPANLMVGDHGGAMAAAFAILAAVLCARRTGEGEHIDVSMTDVVASWVAPMGHIDDRRGATAAHIDSPGHGVFEVMGGHVVVGVFSEDHLWDGLCRALDLEGFVGLNIQQRTDRCAELRAAVAQRLQPWDRDELVRRYGDQLPIAPVLTRQQMLEHPNFSERGLVVNDGPDGFRAVGHPIRYRNHPALPPGPAPALDQH
jgi:crotonobetainyl-CoA:carnitine CoA-transferase CaiB-like acyl-CoA transferase